MWMIALLLFANAIALLGLATMLLYAYRWRRIRRQVETERTMHIVSLIVLARSERQFDRRTPIVVEPAQTPAKAGRMMAQPDFGD